MHVCLMKEQSQSQTTEQMYAEIDTAVQYLDPDGSVPRDAIKLIFSIGSPPKEVGFAGLPDEGPSVGDVLRVPATQKLFGHDAMYIVAGTDWDGGLMALKFEAHPTLVPVADIRSVGTTRANVAIPWLAPQTPEELTQTVIDHAASIRTEATQGGKLLVANLVLAGTSAAMHVEACQGLSAVMFIGVTIPSLIRGYNLGVYAQNMETVATNLGIIPPPETAPREE